MVELTEAKKLFEAINERIRRMEATRKHICRPITVGEFASYTIAQQVLTEAARILQEMGFEVKFVRGEMRIFHRDYSNRWCNNLNMIALVKNLTVLLYPEAMIWLKEHHGDPLLPLTVLEKAAKRIEADFQAFMSSLKELAAEKPAAETKKDKCVVTCCYREKCKSTELVFDFD